MGSSHPLWLTWKALFLDGQTAEVSFGLPRPRETRGSVHSGSAPVSWSEDTHIPSSRSPLS